jgi:hypothetical protein
MALTNTIGVPESLKATLVFPYVSGARFAHALLKNGGYSAVDRAFLRPPRSTREILHPDEYLAEKGKAENASSDDSSPATYRDTLGEFSISALFVGEQSLKSRAAQIAAGWEDDIVRVNGARGAEEVIWETRWQTDQDAGEFESAYRQLLVSRAQAIKNNASNGQSTIEIDQWKIEITRSAPRETRFLARRTNNASNL